MTPESPAPAIRPELRGPDQHLANGAGAEIDRCLEELARIAQTEQSAQAFYAALLDRTLRLLPAVGGAAWRWTAGRAELLVQCDLPQPLLERPLPPRHEHGERPGQHAYCLPAQARAADGYAADHPHPWPLIVCPVAVSEHNSVVLEIALERDAGLDLQAGAAQLAVVLAEIASDFHRRRELAGLREREARLVQFADLVSRLHQRLNPAATAYAIANDGRLWIGCDRLSVLRLRRGRALTLAVSAVDRVDRKSGQVAALEALAGAVATSGEQLTWSEVGEQELPPQLTGVLQAYLDIGHARQLTAALLRPAPTTDMAQGEQPLGVLIAECFAQDRAIPLLHERASQLARAAGPALANALTHHDLPLLPLQERLAKLSQVVTRRPVAAALCGLALSAAVAAMVLVPAELTVPAEGTLQPQVRRNLFAPHDGVVTEVLKEQGERVAGGEVLLRIRNPSLDLEHSRLSGELQTAQARLNAVRSARSRPQDAQEPSEQDRLASEEQQLVEQMQGLQNQLQVLGQLRSELNITSPQDGMVLTWNTRQLLADRPVKQGHALLAVGDPAGPWQLELEVPDADIGHVLAGQRASEEALPVTFLLASDPALTYRGRLTSLASATDVRDARSVAEAIALLDGPQPEGSRAGSRVTARIHCGQRSVGYVWLHDLIDFVRTAFFF